MDIEPLCTLMGRVVHFLCLIFYMAAAIKPPPSTHSKTNAKSQFFIVFLTLFFISLLIFNPNSNPINSSPTSSTMEINQSPNPHTFSSSSSRGQFGGEAHEVPSGPNPISNR
ncbi:hypothetical protein ES332_A11G156300v1 [Gossypium tomentosum]|uniref:Uncharacterized protein n=1 Tax=Gossypium tomentosum TaxID=34277 RepID=A0A5D2NBM7_GOSTO|nr:hypothetical protein ES332_A11G156300v1 [Gossypium tomentosum]